MCTCSINVIQGCVTEQHIFPSQVKKTLEALRQRQEEEAAHTQSSQNAQGQGAVRAVREKWETEQREATTQLLKLKDRLIDVEKNVGHLPECS